MEITDQDKLNNPGVDEHTIQSVKAQYSPLKWRNQC